MVWCAMLPIRPRFFGHPADPMPCSLRAVSLVMHPLALAPLLIGLLGLVSVEVQIAAARAIGDAAAASTNASIASTSQSMAAQLNDELAARANVFARGMNADIAKVQKVLDDDVFGEWVNTTTVVLK